MKVAFSEILAHLLYSLLNIQSGGGGREPCSPQRSPRRASCSGCCFWRWNGWCWVLPGAPHLLLQTSISCPLPLEAPCPAPCPDLITRRAHTGPGITSPLCPYTDPQPHYEPATVSFGSTFSPLVSLAPLSNTERHKPPFCSPPLFTSTEHIHSVVTPPHRAIFQRWHLL